MGNKYLKQLLSKYFSSGVTKEEKSYVEKYYDLFENEPDVFDTLNAGEKNKLKDDLKKAIDRSIEEEVPAGKIIPIFSRRAMVIAAAIASVIIAVGVIYQNAGLKKAEVPAMLAIQAQKNQTILLSDGSKIILYPGSNLRYPASFNGEQKRAVILEGQAFFDISHDATKPFVIHTGNLETKVLGTAFLIKAFAGDNEISVTVNRGKVQVNDQHKQLGIIIRNEQIVYNKQKEIFVQNTVDSDSLSVWARQELHIDNLTLAEAVLLLEKQFSVSMRISDKLTSSKRFNATFPASVNLDQALKIVCEFNEVTYHYGKQNDSVFIEPKSK